MQKLRRCFDPAGQEQKYSEEIKKDFERKRRIIK